MSIKIWKEGKGVKEEENKGGGEDTIREEIYLQLQDPSI